MYKLFPDKEVRCKKIYIPRRDGKNIPALVVSPKLRIKNAPGILWIHGGGYMTGMKEMVHMSRAVDLVKKYGATVISPGYRLSFVKPFPTAMEDCYDALLYLKNHVEDFGINKNQIMVGGESAGGGLCAAVCMMARDKGDVRIAYQMPFYAETCTYIENLCKAGVEAEIDIYNSDMHAFDMLKPELEISKEAAMKFNKHFEYAMEHYFAEN